MVVQLVGMKVGKKDENLVDEMDGLLVVSLAVLMADMMVVMLDS